MPPVIALHAGPEELQRLSQNAIRDGKLGAAADLGAVPQPGAEAIGLPLAMAGDELPVIAWRSPLANGETATVLIASQLEDLDGLEAGFIPLRLAMEVVGDAGRLVREHGLQDQLDLSLEAEEAADVILFEELLAGEDENEDGA